MASPNQAIAWSTVYAMARMAEKMREKYGDKDTLDGLVALGEMLAPVIDKDVAARLESLLDGVMNERDDPFKTTEEKGRKLFG